jgi:Zinc binding domain
MIRERRKKSRTSQRCAVSAESGSAPLILSCPVTGTPSKQVHTLTIRSLIRQLPLGMPKTQYYFCEAAGCDVVYFPLNKRAPVFHRGDLIVRVGGKETAEPIPICYCFGFTRKGILKEIAETGDSTVADRISTEVKKGNCACEVKNPSGKCCLGNVAREVKAAYEQIKESGLDSSDSLGRSRNNHHEY